MKKVLFFAILTVSLFSGEVQFSDGTKIKMSNAEAMSYFNKLERSSVPRSVYEIYKDNQDNILIEVSRTSEAIGVDAGSLFREAVIGSHDAGVSTGRTFKEWFGW